MTPYRHNKSGNRYWLLARAIDCTNDRGDAPTAVYCPDNEENSIFVRDWAEFHSKFTPEFASETLDSPKVV